MIIFRSIHTFVVIFTPTMFLTMLFCTRIQFSREEKKIIDVRSIIIPCERRFKEITNEIRHFWNEFKLHDDRTL